MLPQMRTILVLLALVLPPAASASLPIHQGHPILPVSAAEAKRERAMVKTYHLRSVQTP